MIGHTSHGAPISIPRLGQNGSGSPPSNFLNDYIMQSDGAQLTGNVQMLGRERKSGKTANSLQSNDEPGN